MSKLIISESEKKRILSLHNRERNKLFLNEEEPIKVEQKEFPLQKLGNLFEYGQYKSDKVKTFIVNLKPQIENFIKKSDSRNFTVNIIAGESKVTNPKGFETKGSLALARANEVEKYFKEIFPDLIKNSTLTINSPKSVNEVKIGETPYIKGQQNDPVLKKKYAEEQFVDFSIVGVGQKRGKLDFCSKASQQASGAFIPSSQDFTTINEWVIGEGEGNFFIYYDAYTMPDILYFEYNGETYPKNQEITFRGQDAPWTRVLIGTALRTKFGDGGSLPSQFGKTTYQTLPINEFLKNALMDVKGTGWGMKESFINVFGPGQEFENNEITQAFDNFDNDNRKNAVNQLLKTIGNKIKWGYLTSPILPGIVKNIPMTKIEGINTIKIINIAPNGGTKWRVGTTCKEF